MTIVINIKDAPAKWEENLDYVYIGRGSYWGNPFVMSAYNSRDFVCDEYEKYFYEQPQEYRDFTSKLLKDKTLVCFCAPKRCHGETLINYGNGIWKT